MFVSSKVMNISDRFPYSLSKFRKYKGKIYLLCINADKWQVRKGRRQVRLFFADEMITQKIV